MTFHYSNNLCDKGVSFEDTFLSFFLSFLRIRIFSSGTTKELWNQYSERSLGSNYKLGLCRLCHLKVKSGAQHASRCDLLCRLVVFLMFLGAEANGSEPQHGNCDTVGGHRQIDRSGID